MLILNVFSSNLVYNPVYKCKPCMVVSYNNIALTQQQIIMDRLQFYSDVVFVIFDKCITYRCAHKLLDIFFNAFA